MFEHISDSFRILFFQLMSALLFLLTGCTLQAEPMKNGLDLENSVVPPSKIKGGGPPKDGIPALTNPKTIPPNKADYLNDSDMVIGVAFNGEARAYPLNILAHHENVNDIVGEIPVAVTY